MKIDRIEEVDYDVCLHNGKIIPVAEVPAEEEAKPVIEPTTEEG